MGNILSGLVLVNGTDIWTEYGVFLEMCIRDRARITGLVEKAVVEKRLGEDKKTQFIELGKKVGVDELKNCLLYTSNRVFHH